MTELLIIGAGPAGMAAAITAAEKGTKVTVIDNRSEPGGNIYASLRSTKSKRPIVWRNLGSSYHGGEALIEKFLRSSAVYLPLHSLWHLDPDGTASAKGPDGLKFFKPKRVILATGAQERPMPIENWTLPGVMGVGAAQILLKNSGQLTQTPTVILGTGPLPLLYATQVLANGGTIAAFIEPKFSRQLSTCAGELMGAWYGGGYLLKGLSYLIRRSLARIPIYRNASDIRLVGSTQVEGIKFRTKEVERHLLASSVLLHDGVVPNINPAAAAGLELKRNAQQDCWYPEPNEIIRVAGDVGGILGAKAAEITGELAALESLNSKVPTSLKRKLNKERKFRHFIDAMYPPIGSGSLANDETLICRCEAVSKLAIRSNIATTNGDPNRIKTNLRCGMGPCQGRMCSLSIETIIGNEQGKPKESIGLPRLRNPIVPVTLDELADLDITETEFSE